MGNDTLLRVIPACPPETSESSVACGNSLCTGSRVKPGKTLGERMIG